MTLIHVPFTEHSELHYTEYSKWNAVVQTQPPQHLALVGKAFWLARGIMINSCFIYTMCQANSCHFFMNSWTGFELRLTDVCKGPIGFFDIFFDLIFGSRWTSNVHSACWCKALQNSLSIHSMAVSLTVSHIVELLQCHSAGSALAIGLWRLWGHLTFQNM